MNDPIRDEWHRLFSAALNGTISGEEKQQLAAVLKSSAEARQLWFLYHDNECGLAEMRRPQAASPALRAHGFRSAWLSWRPLTAAAAGVLLGLSCASLAWAYVAPRAGKVMTLWREGFESGPAPLVTGVPNEPGVWGGDYSEIVSGQQGVMPAEGAKMLRFLRGDYEGRAIPESHSSDVFRLVDVRHCQREFADGGAVVQLAALFNAAASGAGNPVHGTLTIFALDASLVDAGLLKTDNVLSQESLAFSRSSKVMLDGDPATWQRVSNELRVPPQTEYLMIRIGVSHDPRQKGRRKDSFAGHFADGVRLLIARRPEIAAR